METARSNQETLLGATQQADHEQQKFDCEIGGRPNTLLIRPDGTCALAQALANQGCFGSCFGDASSGQQEVPGANIVGVSQGDTVSTLRLWHCPLRGGNTDKPRRKLVKSPPIRLAEHRCREVAHALRRRCCWGGREAPRRLLVIINPASGPGRAPAIFEKQVKPVLEAAGLILKVHVTMHRRHATEILQDTKPGDYDAVVSIGGDGTTYEVLQGLLGRSDWDAMRRLPLVQVPCGSGNALAASTGLWDPLTAAFAIVRGATSALDIVSVLQPPGRRYYSFLSLTFGLIPNLDIGTEHLRWMGGTRFTVGALKQILLAKTHVARVAILEAGTAGAPAAGREDGHAEGGEAGAVGMAGSAAAAAGGAGGILPGAGGRVAGPQFDWGKVEAATQAGPSLQHIQEFHLLSDHASLEDLTLPPAWRWLPPAPLQLFATCNLPRLDMNFLLAPDAQLNSGHINLIYTAKQSRLRGLEIMTKAEKGQHMHLVQQLRVVALALEPVTTGTWLVVDGEEVPFQTVFLEVHPSLCHVIVAP